MTKQKLKILKTGKKQVNRTSGTSKRQRRIFHLQPPTLTPAEQAEVARFRALTLKRAVHRAQVRRTMAQLEELEANAAA
jgi:hypothetical protein